MDKRDRLLWVPFPTVFYLFVFQLPLTSHSSSCPCSLLWVFWWNAEHALAFLSTAALSEELGSAGISLCTCSQPDVFTRLL